VRPGFWDHMSNSIHLLCTGRPFGSKSPPPQYKFQLSLMSGFSALMEFMPPEAEHLHSKIREYATLLSRADEGELRLSRDVFRDMQHTAMESARHLDLVSFQQGGFVHFFEIAVKISTPLPPHPTRHDRRNRAAMLAVAKQHGISLSSSGRMRITSVPNLAELYFVTATEETRRLAKFVGDSTYGFAKETYDHVVRILHDLEALDSDYVHELDAVELDMFQQSYAVSRSGLTDACLMMRSPYRDEGKLAFCGLQDMEAVHTSSDAFMLIGLRIKIEISARRLRDILLIVTGCTPTPGSHDLGIALVRTIIRLRGIATHRLTLQLTKSLREQ